MFDLSTFAIPKFWFAVLSSQIVSGVPRHPRRRAPFKLIDLPMIFGDLFSLVVKGQLRTWKAPACSDAAWSSKVGRSHEWGPAPGNPRRVCDTACCEVSEARKKPPPKNLPPQTFQSSRKNAREIRLRCLRTMGSPEPEDAERTPDKFCGRRPEYPPKEAWTRIGVSRRDAVC